MACSGTPVEPDPGTTFTYELSIEQPTILHLTASCPDDPLRSCSRDEERTDWTIAGEIEVTSRNELEGAVQLAGNAMLTTNCRNDGCESTDWRFGSRGNEHANFGGGSPVRLVLGFVELHGEEIAGGGFAGRLYWIHTLGRNLTWQEATFRMMPLE